MHCEFLYREHRKPRWISTLNQKHLFCETPPWPQPIYWVYIFISTAKQWNQEQNSVKHKLGKHQRVRRRKIRRSGGLQAVGRPVQHPKAGLPLFLLCWLQSFTRRCSLEFQSWVQRIDKGFCALTPSSYHHFIAWGQAKVQAWGGGGVSALCCQWFWGAKRKRNKEK